MYLKISRKTNKITKKETLLHVLFLILLCSFVSITVSVVSGLKYKKNQNERIAFKIIVVVTCLENLQIENKTINLILLDCFNFIC